MSKKVEMWYGYWKMLGFLNKDGFVVFKRIKKPNTSLEYKLITKHKAQRRWSKTKAKVKLINYKRLLLSCMTQYEHLKIEMLQQGHFPCLQYLMKYKEK